MSVETWKQYQSWLHYEDVFVPTEHAAFAEQVQEEFFSRFSKPEHAGLSHTPYFLVKDAQAQAHADTPTVTSCTTPAQRLALHRDAQAFMHNYKHDLQFVFNRVQHHCHKKTAKGFCPLKACRIKCNSKRKAGMKDECKAGFPKTHLKTDRHVIVCRGVARRFKLRISGRRNAFGCMVGKRSCEWQSGTAPAFAAVFRSNTHTLPNHRAPIRPETHDGELCQSRTCQAAMHNPNEITIMGKLAQ